MQHHSTSKRFESFQNTGSVHRELKFTMHWSTKLVLIAFVCLYCFVFWKDRKIVQTYNTEIVNLENTEEVSTPNGTALVDAIASASSPLQLVVNNTASEKCQGGCSGIFDEDPFRDFRSELSWIPNRTLVPWDRLGRKPPCIMEVGVDRPLNSKRQRRPTPQGILYIKPEKAASSTLAGVAARIAYKLFDLTNTSAIAAAENISVKPICRVRLTHAWSRQSPKPFTSRDRNNSFLFTFLRNPGKRSLSEFYYFGVDGRNITGKEVEPTAAEALEYVQSPRHANSQFTKCWDVGMKPSLTAMVTENMTWQEKMALRVQIAVNELDYIGIVERMEYVEVQMVLSIVS